MARRGRPSEPIRPRFYEKFIRDENGCWIWVGSGCNGYGHIWISGRCRRAHQVSWEIHHGPIPDGLYVCHRCDVKLCVNPDHLFLGTHQDNMNDMAQKTRSTKGRHRFDTARAIDLQAQGLSNGEIGSVLGVHRDTVRRFLSRR
jgi:hypothetical protein